MGAIKLDVCMLRLQEGTRCAGARMADEFEPERGWKGVLGARMRVRE